MNKKLRNLFVMAFTLVLASCMGEVADPADNADVLGGNVAAVTEQVEAIQASLADVKAVKEGLNNVSDLQDAEAFEAQLDACISGIESHIASVKGGVSALNATLAAMNLQAEIASVAGAIKASYGTSSEIIALEKGVKAWLGDKFENFYVASSESARVKSMMTTVEAQGLTIDALVSDVEAGLRVGDADGSLSKVGAEVAETTKKLVALDQKLAVLCTELQSGYESAIKNSGSDVKKSLKTLNLNATTTLQEVGTSISTLSVSVAEAAVSIADLQDRLAKVETDVEGLLNRIQSLTFMSDYSSDYAVAYYEMNNNKVSAPGKVYDGKNQRDAAGTIDLSFMVRPAAAAVAVTDQTASIFGYYADQIATRAVDPSNFVNFQVKSVSVTNAERGIVTVRISHDLKDDFYYKQVGVKCALSIATGKTDLTSKFIELVPKDNSSTVYVEGIKINNDDFEIDEGQSKNLTVTVNPATATNKTVTWTSSNTEIATIDQYSGALTVVKQGNVTITATTNGIDEWGDNLTASVNVKVNPSIRLGGPTYVEVGKTAELTLDFPPTMNVEAGKVWLSSDETKATVENGIVTGVADTYNTYTYQYNPVTITCIVNGEITLTHLMDVAILQPRNIVLSKLDDSKDLFEIKVDQSLDLSATTSPVVNLVDQFDIYYEVDNAYKGLMNFDTGMFNQYNRTMPAGTATVTITVKNYDKHHYLKIGERKRYVNVRVLPYYVQSISMSDIELQPGATATLAPTIISDTDGKIPTNSKLTWVSENDAIATVDENGVVTAHSIGDVTITATATDGSNVSGTCKVSVVEPWKSFNIGDYVVRKGNGEIEFFASSVDAQNNGTVVGIVIYKGNPRVTDTQLPEECTHGIALGLKESEQYRWWEASISQSETIRSLYDYHLNNSGFASPLGLDGNYAGYWRTDLADKPYGYNNTLMLKNVVNSGRTSSNLVTSLNSISLSVSLPTGTSAWYIPSIFEMDQIHKCVAENDINTNLSSVSSAAQLRNEDYWTVSEVAGNYRTNAAYVNPVTGSIYSGFKTSKYFRVRYVFAF